MKFVSLRRKQAHQPSKLAKPSRANRDSLTTAPAPLTKIHTYAELRQQVRDDLRLQHPEWIQPDGESPICDSYEARLMELLGGERLRKGLAP
jgi:hypothetical protein